MTPDLQHMSFPEREVNHPLLGIVKICVNSQHSIFIEAQEAVVNTVIIRSFCHFKRENGVWDAHKDYPSQSPFYALSATRVQEFNKEVSEAARKKIFNAFLEAIKAFDIPENSKLFIEAEHAKTNNQLRFKDEEARNLQQKLDGLNEERRKLWKRVQELAVKLA